MSRFKISYMGLETPIKLIRQVLGHTSSDQDIKFSSLILMVLIKDCRKVKLKFVSICVCDRTERRCSNKGATPEDLSPYMGKSQALRPRKTW